MSRTPKPQVSMADSFDQLDIRVGEVLAAEIEPSAPKSSYRLRIDFGKFGVKTSVARLTQHSMDDIVGKQVLAILNIGSRQVGDVLSEVLVLGVQLPKQDSGEATFITPSLPVKIGSKLS